MHKHRLKLGYFMMYSDVLFCKNSEFFRITIPGNSRHFFVYMPPPQNASVNGSKNAHHHHTSADDGGRFLHHPYGEAPQNPVPCKVATPLYSLTSIPSGSPPTTSGWILISFD